MTSRNQFILLNKKCEAYFDLLEKELGKTLKISKESDKARLGFYLYMLECITDIKDINELISYITDTDFNKIINGCGINDYGIDAVHINHEENIINLFNFKYREGYKPDKKQSVNELFSSTKFTTAILSENTEHLEGKLKDASDEILTCLNSKEIWRMKLYMVSNEEVGIDELSGEIEAFKAAYDLEICCITMPMISNFTSLKPEPINSKLMITPNEVLSYSEGGLSSALSYVLKLPLSELVRITCDNKATREDSNIEDINLLNHTKLDYAALYENVRGFLGETKYNKNIYKTLQEEPTKFFMYNNGVTITADNIDVAEINGGRFVKLDINNMQVVNGGQTLRTIHFFKEKNHENLENFLSRGEVLVRIFKTGNNADLTSKIAEFTNSQNSISEINLKSLAYEQIQIEQYLNDCGIIYARKSGDTGIFDREYRHKISLEKFAQILFSKNGNPDKATNQKKRIFDKYYQETFITNFEIEQSDKLVDRYYEVKNIYREHFEHYELNEQKVFYMLYLDGSTTKNDKEKIELIEDALNSYRKGEDISPVRKMSQKGFKEYLDSIAK